MRLLDKILGIKPTTLGDDADVAAAIERLGQLAKEAQRLAYRAGVLDGMKIIVDGAISDPEAQRQLREKIAEMREEYGIPDSTEEEPADPELAKVVSITRARDAD